MKDSIDLMLTKYEIGMRYQEITSNSEPNAALINLLHPNSQIKDFEGLESFDLAVCHAEILYQIGEKDLFQVALETWGEQISEMIKQKASTIGYTGKNPASIIKDFSTLPFKKSQSSSKLRYYNDTVELMKIVQALLTDFEWLTNNLPGLRNVSNWDNFWNNEVKRYGSKFSTLSENLTQYRSEYSSAGSSGPVVPFEDSDWNDSKFKQMAVRYSTIYPKIYSLLSKAEHRYTAIQKYNRLIGTYHENVKLKRSQKPTVSYVTIFRVTSKVHHMYHKMASLLASLDGSLQRSLILTSRNYTLTK